MQRKVIEKLIQWKANARRKPLLVRGARQVGKTYTIMEFGQIHFNGNIYAFNFEKNPEIHSIFEQNLDSKRIIAELSVISAISIVKRSSTFGLNCGFTLKLATSSSLL